jgi:hypothetical protein
VLEELSTDTSLRSVTVTRNVEAIVAAAYSDLAAIFGNSETLSADALLSALLCQPRTSVEGRLKKRQITLQDIRLGVLAEVGKLDPTRVDRWRRTLRAVVSVPESSAYAGTAVSASGESSVTHAPTSSSPPSTTISASAPLDIAIIAIARMGNDNPDREQLDDKLGVRDEAFAFARVAAARQVDPPLAFGIFGDWGSGKSFFMRLMQEQVEKLAKKMADEAKTDLFHENIVQIRFNAWHYVDTNLWASLVDHIFIELDRWVQKKMHSSEQITLFDKLATARDLTLESAETLLRRRKEQQIAANRLAAAERELTAARETATGAPHLFWAVVQKNLGCLIKKKDLDEAAATLGLDRLATDAEMLKRALDSLSAEGERTKAVANGIRHQLLSAPSLILILAAIILVPPILLWLRNEIISSLPSLKTFIDDINTTVLSVAGLLASAATLLGVITRRVRSAVDTLEGFRGELNTLIAEQVRKPTDDVKSAEKDLAKLSAEVAEARALLATTSDRLAEAARDYASGTGRGRLRDSFASERATVNTQSTSV